MELIDLFRELPEYSCGSIVRTRETPGGIKVDLGYSFT